MKKYLLSLVALAAMFSAQAQTVWHVCGDFNGWAPEDTSISFYETSDPNVLQATAGEFKTGQWGFKIIDGTSWGCQEIGATADNVVTATINGEAGDVMLGGKNIYLNEVNKKLVLTDALFTLTFVDGTPSKLEVTCTKCVDEADSYYMPGTCKGWNFNETTKFTYEGNGVYTLAYDDFYGDFKVVKNGSWGSDNEFAGAGNNMMPGNEYTLVKGGSNTGFAPGVQVKNIVFTLTVAADGTHTLKVEGTAREEHSYGLVGGFQGWDAGKAPLFEEQADGSFVLDVKDFPGNTGFKVSIDKTWTCFCPKSANQHMEFGVPVTCDRADGKDYTIGEADKKYDVHVVLVVADDYQSATLTITDVATGMILLNTNVDADIIYNISGQRLAQPQKGLNIINGKKVMVK